MFRNTTRRIVNNANSVAPVLTDSRRCGKVTCPPLGSILVRQQSLQAVAIEAVQRVDALDCSTSVERAASYGSATNRVPRRVTVK